MFVTTTNNYNAPIHNNMTITMLPCVIVSMDSYGPLLVKYSKFQSSRRLNRFF